jgi:hypothetical protein
MKDTNETTATNTLKCSPVQHLDQKTLAERWQVSPRTLEQWRWRGQGPRFLKIGGRVIYRLSDVEAFEVSSLHANTTGPLGSANLLEADCDAR